MNSKYQLPKDGGLIKDNAPKDIIHRYERMPTRVFENEYNGVQYVADIICRLVRQHGENASARDIYQLNDGWEFFFKTYTRSCLHLCSA